MSDADWNGWGNDLANTRYQPKPGLAAADVPKLKLKWAFAFEGDTVRSAQPVVVGNRVFTGSASGAVYSLDAETGCSYWKYSAGAMVRNAISIGQAGGKTIAYFGDIRANVHALDVADGRTTVEGQGGRLPGRAHHRVADLLRGPAVRPRVVGGRSFRDVAHL